MAKKLNILKNDSWLEPYAAAIEGRHADAVRKEQQLTGDAGSLSDFANAHRYFGLHRHGRYGWTFREWAPNATAIYLIGDFNGWAASEPMTPSDDNLTWKATVTMSAGNAWKFRMNNGWDINLGGNLQNLTGFGNPANLVCDADGTYEITLYLGTIPYTATMVKK